MTSTRFGQVVLACVIIMIAGCTVTTEPLEPEDIETIAAMDRELIFDAQEEIEGELTLEMAMAMALKYNLESRVRLLEEAVANQQRSMTTMEMLPSLAASAGYLERDNANASRSISIESGQESLEPSTSQENAQSNARASFAWNLLDFGVSYLQARQDADRFLIAEKAREKVMLTLLKDVRGAYWQAVAMEQMREDLDSISAQVDEMLNYWQAIREERLRPPIAVLMDIRALVETRQQLDEIRRSIDTAGARLANLINARDVRSLKFPKEQDFPSLEAVTSDVEALELVALANSTDYASEIYQVRIEQLESRKAMLRLLPGLEFTYGENYNDNSYLLNNRWGEFGLNLTGDLSQLMFTNRIRKFRETNEQLTISRKLAINMAVITRVHIAWQDYKNSIAQLERADYLREIDEQISFLTDNAQANRAETGAAAIQNQLRAFRSKISQMQSYADAQQAYGSFVVSLGVNPIPQDYHKMPAQQLAAEVSNRFDEEIFPYTQRGQLLMAERQKLDQWISESRASQVEEPAALEEPEEPVIAIIEPDESEPVEVVEEDIAEETQPAPETEIAATTPADDVDMIAQAEVPESRPEEILQFSSETTPSLSEFLAYFWLKYFPQPSVREYIDEFLANPPVPPSRQGYLDHFLANLPDGPNRDAYLNLFLNNLPDGPNRDAYLKLFLENLKAGPSKDAYIQLFLENLKDGPSRSDYLQLFLDNLKDGPSRSEYLQLFLDNLKDGPSRDAYLKLFLENLKPGPDRDAYLQLFLNSLPDGPSREAYLQLFLNKVKQAPDIRRYVREFQESRAEQ